MQEYQFITYFNAFSGHESDRVGASLIKEDFTVIVPRFLTEFQIADISINENKTKDIEPLVYGNFIDVFTPRAKKMHNDIMVYGNYNTFAGGFRQYKNLLIQDQKRILLIADSFGYPYATYLATAFEYVDHLYLSPGSDCPLYPALESENYDMVLFLLSDGTVAYKYSDSFEADRLYLGEVPR